jgi:hypothetical protein
VTDLRRIGAAATVRSPLEISKMKILLTRYLTALICMLAVGTWILPVHTLAAPTPRFRSADDESYPALLALRNSLEAMRVAGQLDYATFSFSSGDLTGDGIADSIDVFPPQRLETPGSMRVIDGATGSERYTLRAAAGEMGFGEHAAIVDDADGDSLPDIAAFTWAPVGGIASEEPILLRVRVFSGDSGELIGLLETVSQHAEVPDLLDYDVVIAGDANLDGVLNATDVIDASAALATDAALTPTVDCKADGAITIEDFGSVVQRVTEEPIAQRMGLYSVALRNLSVVAPIEPPGSATNPSQTGGGGGGAAPCVTTWQGGWKCWLSLAVLAAKTAKLILQLVACSGPQLVACALPLLCSLLTLLGGWMEFYNQCLQTPACVSPLWTTINYLLLAIGAICELGTFTHQNWEKIKDGLKRLRDLRVSTLAEP